MAYPDNLSTFRTIENRADVVYDPTKRTRVFSEDITVGQQAITQTQEFLGQVETFYGDSISDATQNIGVLAEDATYYGKTAEKAANDAMAEALAAWDYADQAYALAQEAYDLASV